MNWRKIFGFLEKAENKIRNENLNKAAENLAILMDHTKSKKEIEDAAINFNSLFKNQTPERRAALKQKTCSDPILDSANGKDFKLPESKNAKDIIFHFFGMDENWPIWRSLLGGFLVHSPEYPTYFIPAFTQAKATGDAKELKKGEGPRGLITGGLEGVAVGALVSGKNIWNPREMLPYIVLGAALQLFSSKVFPWIGEKTGRLVYFTRRNKIFHSSSVHEDFETFHNKPKQKIAEFKGTNNPTEKPKQAELKTPSFSGTYKPFSTNMRI